MQLTQRTYEIVAQYLFKHHDGLRGVKINYTNKGIGLFVYRPKNEYHGFFVRKPTSEYVKKNYLIIPGSKMQEAYDIINEYLK